MSSILSTLSPLSTRLLTHFWWFLSYLHAQPPKQTTFTQLNDDCLLLILEYFTVSELLRLRAVSRRLSTLIQQYRLPQYRTLLYGYSPAETKQREDVHSDNGQQVKVYLTTQHHPFSDFNRQRGLGPCDHSPFYNQPRQPMPLNLSSLPLSLPFQIPRLSNLTFTYFLMDEKELLTNEQMTVNKLCTHYLRSSWSGTLVSLHLYLSVPKKPHSYHAFFGLINKLAALKHLFLEFTQFRKTGESSLLPDTMSIFRQLTSFKLNNYGSQNTALLLAQLGPSLTYLSLHDVSCSVAQFVDFLHSKPTYRQTLKTLEVYLHEILDWQVFTVAARNLPSLERAVISFASPDFELLPFFTDMSQLTHLREMIYVPLYISQLRAFLLLHPQPGVLPRLPSIRRATIAIFNFQEVFEPEELFNEMLPLLADIFINLEYLDIGFSPQNPMGQYSESLSLRLVNRVAQLFGKLRHCSAGYFSR